MPTLTDQLHSLRDAALAAVTATTTPQDLESVRLTYFARKDGLLSRLFEQLPTLPPEEKKTFGREANEVKKVLEEALSNRKKSLDDAALEAVLTQDRPDLTLPGTPRFRGGAHPLTTVSGELVDVFLRLGFTLAEGPEVEDDVHNFTALNHPPDHPARDSHDTFYLKEDRDDHGRPLLLRTHTSPVQIRYMLGHKPPVYIVAPGRVFRHENIDATHAFTFHQVEGFAVDKNLSLADLKGVLQLMARRVFGPDVTIRFRPSYFPFVEPGLEVDVSCAFCAGKGCRVCKQTGWVEMLGAGLIHPNVLRSVGYDPEVWSGWAFGIGVERVAMFKYGVDDIRHFTENDQRFLELFS